MRANVKPTIILALNKSEAVRALGLGRNGLKRIDDALDAGIVEARVIGKMIKLPVWGPKGLQSWFESFPRYTRRTTRKVR